MNERLRGFLGFLGLVEDDYGDYQNSAPRPFSEAPEPEWAPEPARPARAPAPRAVSPERVVRRPGGAVSVIDGGGDPPRVRPIANPNPPRRVAAAEGDVAVVAPETYDESRRITDQLRTGRPVVLATPDADPSLARRLVDFAAGTAYAMGARIEILARGVYLVVPGGVHVGAETKERLRSTDFRSGSRWPSSTN
jgi:cell division inhibitor SepF